jgi:hypothetical protein
MIGLTVPGPSNICGLCGRPFAMLIPEGVEETERDRLWSYCRRWPEPPEEPAS